MDILKEYYPITLTDQQLNEAMDTTRGAPMVIKKVLLQRANAENRNKRIYPKSVLEREINKYNEGMVKTRRALGELDHTDSMTVNLKNASHLITEMWWEGDDVYGNVEILDSPEFPAGMIAAGLLRRNIPVGISSRALGSTTPVNGLQMVNDDLSLACFDLVSFESTIGSNLALNEGAEILPNKYETFDSIIYDIICNASGACMCKFK